MRHRQNPEDKHVTCCGDLMSGETLVPRLKIQTETKQQYVGAAKLIFQDSNAKAG